MAVATFNAHFQFHLWFFNEVLSSLGCIASDGSMISDPYLFLKCQMKTTENSVNIAYVEAEIRT